MRVRRGRGDRVGVLERHIVGIGRNYAEHARPSRASVPDRPMVFTKNPAPRASTATRSIPRAATATGGPHQVDFRGRARGDPRAGVPRRPSRAALEHVLGGQAGANDVERAGGRSRGPAGSLAAARASTPSARWARSVVEPGEVGMQALSWRCRVNGETM
ncbi:MAG: hypothetical protein R3B49_01675 [Phycisphaerales bacterium]